VTQVTNVNSSTAAFNVTMQGRDQGGGVLKTLALYVSVDGNAATHVTSLPAGSPNAQGVYRVTTTYQALADRVPHTYRLFSIGTDDSGNVEPTHASPNDVVVTKTIATVPQRLTKIIVQNGEEERSTVRFLTAIFATTDVSAIAASLS